MPPIGAGMVVQRCRVLVSAGNKALLDLQGIKHCRNAVYKPHGGEYASIVVRWYDFTPNAKNAVLPRSAFATT